MQSLSNFASNPTQATSYSTAAGAPKAGVAVDQKSAASTAIGPKVEIVKFGNAHYVRARIPCARTPIPLAKSQAIQGSGSSGKALAQYRTVHIPLELTESNLSRTFNEMLRNGISLIDADAVAQAICNIRRGVLEALSGSTRPDSKALRSEAEKTPFSPDRVARNLKAHTRTRTTSPGRRREAMVMEGDELSWKAFRSGAPVLDLSRGLASVKEQKSVETAPKIKTSTRAPHPWEDTSFEAWGGRQITAPAWLSKRFFNHLARTGSRVDKRSTGHLRVSHDSNAFPRTWSLEKIGRIAAAALWEDWQARRTSPKGFDENAVICASYAGLNIFVGLGNDGMDAWKAGLPARKASGMSGPADKNPGFNGAIVSAYVSRTTSARSAERAELKRAKSLLMQIQNPRAKQIADTARHFDLWSILGAAKALCIARDKLQLKRVERDAIDQLKDLLSLDETRHPLHQSRIDQHAANSLAKAAFWKEANAFDLTLESLEKQIKSATGGASPANAGPAGSQPKVDGKATQK